MAKNYTPDSLERALQHHVREGRLHGYRRIMDEKTVVSRRRWYVYGNSLTNPPSMWLTDAECHVLCFGLASAQYGTAAKESSSAS